MVSTRSSARKPPISTIPSSSNSPSARDNTRIRDDPPPPFPLQLPPSPAAACSDSDAPEEETAIAARNRASRIMTTERNAVASVRDAKVARRRAREVRLREAAEKRRRAEEEKEMEAGEEIGAGELEEGDVEGKKGAEIEEGGRLSGKALMGVANALSEARKAERKKEKERKLKMQRGRAGVRKRRVVGGIEVTIGDEYARMGRVGGGGGGKGRVSAEKFLERCMREGPARVSGREMLKQMNRRRTSFVRSKYTNL